MMMMILGMMIVMLMLGMIGGGITFLLVGRWEMLVVVGKCATRLLVSII